MALRESLRYGTENLGTLPQLRQALAVCAQAQTAADLEAFLAHVRYGDHYDPSGQAGPQALEKAAREVNAQGNLPSELSLYDAQGKNPQLMQYGNMLGLFEGLGVIPPRQNWERQFPQGATTIHDLLRLLRQTDGDGQAQIVDFAKPTRFEGVTLHIGHNETAVEQSTPTATLASLKINYIKLSIDQNQAA